MATQLEGPTTVLNAVTATGRGTTNVDGRKASGSTWYITASSVTSGGTVKIEANVADNTTAANYATLATVNVTADGTQVVTVDEPHCFLNANLSARTDGTFTVKCVLWRGDR